MTCDGVSYCERGCLHQDEPRARDGLSQNLALILPICTMCVTNSVQISTSYVDCGDISSAPSCLQVDGCGNLLPQTNSAFQMLLLQDKRPGGEAS